MRTDQRKHGRARHRHGAALFLVTLILLVVTGLALSFAAITTSSSHEQRGSNEDLKTRNTAEAGLNEALGILTAGGRAALDASLWPRAMGGARFTVAATYGEDVPTMDDDLVVLAATAVYGSETATLELIIRDVTPPAFEYAAFSKTNLTVGNGVLIDSYDSRLGTYASQVPGASDHALENAKIGSNDDISLMDTSVYGDAFYGPDPGDGISMSPGAILSGSHGPLAEPFVLPSFDVPAIPPTADLIVGTDQVLTSGTYRFGTVDVDTDSELTIQGPATLVVDDFYLQRESSFSIDSSGGKVQVFVRGDFVLDQSSDFNTSGGGPGDAAIYLESDNVTGDDEVTFKPRGNFSGTILAPTADLEIYPGFELFGAFMAYGLNFKAGVLVHFDEALMAGDGAGARIYDRVSWRPRAVDQTAAATLHATAGYPR